MAFLIDFEVNTAAAFRVGIWGSSRGSRMTPLDPGALKSIERIADRGDLDLRDFAYVDWTENIGVFVASRRAVDGLLRNQPGLVVLGEVPAEPTHLLVQIVLQLDLADVERSIPSPIGFGILEGVQLLDRADEIAGVSVFLIPAPSSGDLFCSESWRQAYLDLGLSGLNFRVAQVD